MEVSLGLARKLCLTLDDGDRGFIPRHLEASSGGAQITVDGLLNVLTHAAPLSDPPVAKILQLLLLAETQQPIPSW